MNIVPQSPGNDGRPAHGIGDSLRTPRTSGERRGPEGPASTPTASSLHMSAAGERFVSLRSRLEGLDAARTDRVDRLRQAVASGSYHVSGDAIAAAMLNDPVTAAALGVK